VDQSVTLAAGVASQKAGHERSPVLHVILVSGIQWQNCMVMDDRQVGN